ncbi:MAG: hypothetical protein ABH821_01865 [archaeon]
MRVFYWVGIILLLFIALIVYFNTFPNVVPKPDNLSCGVFGEPVSIVLDDFKSECCSTLTVWASGFDTRVSVNDKCFETGLLAGSPVSTCIKCDDGVCEFPENPCNCLLDCIGKNKSNYKTISDFCNNGFNKYCPNTELELCSLC